MAKFWGNLASGGKEALAGASYRCDAASLFTRKPSIGNTIPHITPNPSNSESYSLARLSQVIQILKSDEEDITAYQNTKDASAYTINLYRCRMAITKPIRAPHTEGTPNLVWPFRLSRNTLASK